jgi:hypothetical protein
MKLSNVISVAAISAAFTFGISNAHAISAPTMPLGGDTVAQPAPSYVEYHWDDAKREKLRHAYWILEKADKDYHGHKAAAMEQIKKAGEIMSLDLHGKGYGGEKQPWSDARLREARGLLADIVSESGGKEHEHLRKAIKEVDKALEVR